MSPKLNCLLTKANNLGASDLHLIAGVPPAVRVNGEIVLADDDATTPDELRYIASSLLNDEQAEKFKKEWELCVSIFHDVAGRMRVTFYQRNSSPELSIRFCGEKIRSREELGLPKKLEER